MKIVIVDIDRTLSKLNAEREAILTELKNNCAPDWDKFYNCDFNDEPINETVSLVQNLYRNYRIVYCTSRSERVRKQTEAWLRDRFPNVLSEDVLMRDNFDKRPAFRVKPDLIRDRGIAFEDISFALDDEDEVVKEFRRLGITCYQTDYELV
jgi:predicted secreted acid phosphatase